MAYDTEELYRKAIEAIKEHKLFFIEDIVGFLPCSKPTFYVHFPIDSNELNEIKRLIENNKIEIKTDLRNKWYNSENPTLQIALYKTICTDEERRRISTNYNEEKREVEFNTPLKIEVIGDKTKDELEKLKESMSE